MASSSLAAPQHGDEAVVKVPVRVLNELMANNDDLQAFINAGKWEKDRDKRMAKLLCGDSNHLLYKASEALGSSDQPDTGQPPPASPPAQGPRRPPALRVRSLASAAKRRPPVPPFDVRQAASLSLDMNQTTGVAEKGKGKVIYMHQNDVCKWKKYGTKKIKSNNNTRCYYKCSDCGAKKKIENDIVVDIKYIENKVCQAPAAAAAEICNKETDDWVWVDSVLHQPIDTGNYLTYEEEGQE